MDIPLVTSYNTPVNRRESFLFFSRPGPSRLQKLSVEDSYLLGESDCHTFLRGPEDISVKRGYTLLDRRVVSYTCVCGCVFLCVWFCTKVFIYTVETLNNMEVRDVDPPHSQKSP